MKLAPHVPETLVFEATRSDDGKAKQLLAIVACLAFSAISGFLFVCLGWWARLDPAGQIAAAILLAAGELALLFVVSGMFPYLSCLALDHSSRRALCVWKSLRRTRSEEFDFEAFEQVKVTQVLGACGRQWWMLRLERDRGRAIELPMHDFRADAGRSQAQDLAAQICDMVGLNHRPKARKSNPVEKRYERVVIFVTGPICIALAFYGARRVPDMWHSPTWPKVAGVVDSFRLYTRHRGRSLADVPAVEIKYRYSVGGVEYHGDRFNVNFDMLSKHEEEFIKLHCQPGQACEVSYKPNNPARSFMMTTDAHYHATTEAVGCGAFALVGLALIAFSSYLLARGNWRLVPPQPRRPASAGAV